MRLLVRHGVHRAFPELDRFSDEKCRRFVDAAGRAWGPRVLRAGIILAVGLSITVGVCLALALFALLLGVADPQVIKPSPIKYVILAVVGLPLLGVGPLLAFYTRDWLLIRRIRYILRARGHCPACSYVLAGLPVSEGNLVVCPECAMECTVDASLSELATDAGGAVRYQPSAEALRRSEPWFTPVRARAIRRVLKWLGVGILTLILIGVGIWGWYEYRLGADAAQALADQPARDALAKLIRNRQGGEATRGMENGWSWAGVVDQALISHGGAEQAVLPDGTLVYIGSYFITDEPHPDMSDAEKDAYVVSRRESYRALEAITKGGVFEKADRFKEFRFASREPDLDQERQRWMTSVVDYAPFRRLARWQAARMFVAIQEGDARKLASAASANLTMARILEGQLMGIDRASGWAIESMTEMWLRTALVRRPDAATVAAVAKALDSVPPPPAYSQLVEGERIQTLDFLAWIYSEPANVRLWSESPLLNRMQLVSGRLTRSPGWYEANRDNINQRFKDLSDAISVDASRRRATYVYEQATSDVDLPAMLTGWTHYTVASVDRLENDRRCLRLMVAIEQHRVAHGEYPVSLDALVPSILVSLPLDTRTGKPFVYRRIDPSADKHSRGYLLLTTNNHEFPSTPHRAGSEGVYNEPEGRK